MLRRRRALAMALAVIAVACGGDDGAGVPPLRVDLVDDAIAAVEQERGGAQVYFEVNASPELVNLFVAVDDATATVPYVYLADGGLQPPAPRQAASGPTFRAADVAFEPDQVLARVVVELPESIPELFVVSAAAGGGVDYRVVMRSERGGQLFVIVAGDGTIVGADAS